jgi:hypothetical protein
MSFFSKLVEKISALLVPRAYKRNRPTGELDSTDAYESQSASQLKQQTLEQPRQDKIQKERQIEKPSWINKWEHYRRSKAWELIRREMLMNNPTCQNCRKAPAKAVRIRSYAEWYSNRTFLEPTEDDLQAVCVECNKELNKPSDWDDPYNPFQPDWQRKKKSKVGVVSDPNQLDLFEKNPNSTRDTN